MRRFNVFSGEFDHESEHAGYGWRAARVGQAVGAAEIGARLFELVDGQPSFPYHFHHGKEEWMIVVAGSPRVRAPDGERVLRAGDVLCFPVGAAGAHQVTGPGTVLVLAPNRSPESVEYPDSGKVAISPPDKIFRTADAVDYWDGE